MAGLDSIKGYDDGGGVSVTESSKGTPQIQGATYLDPEQTGTILQNMQKLIEARSSPMQQFLGGLKGAAAWTSGGINGPSEALNRREEQEQAEQKDTMNMQNQMAMYKAALAQQQAQRQSFLGALNPQQQQGAGAGQAQPQSAGAANIDPTLMAEIQRLAANPATSAQAQAMYQKALTENAGFIAKAKAEHDSEIVEFPVNGQVMKITRGQANQLAQNNPDIAKLLGQGAPAQGAPTGTGQVAADVNNPTGIRINGKFKSYDTPQEGVADSQNLVNQYVAGTGPMQGIKPTPENIAGRWVTGDPNQGSTLQNGAYAKRIRDELQSAGVQLNPDGTVPNTPEAQFAVHRAKIINEAGPNANKFLPFVGGGAPAAAPSGIGNVTQAAVSQAGGVSQATESGKLYAAGEAKLRESGMNAGTRQVNQNATMRLLDDPDLKNLVGKYQTGSKADTFVRQVQAGISAGNFGDIGIKELQENLAKSGASPDAIRKFSQLESNLKQNELEWSTNYLKGQGSVSDSERGLVQKAIGSVNDPIGKLKTLTGVMRERALFDAEVYNAYKQNKNTNFGDFLDSQRFQELNDKHNNRLANILNMDPKDLKANDGFTIRNNIPEGPPTVTSKEQYDGLKSGTIYLENGKKFRKP